MPFIAAEDGQIGMLRVEAGQGIDLDEMRPPPGVAADIDPAGVAAAQDAVGGQGHGLRLADLLVLAPAGRGR